MGIILNLETATTNCSVSLARAGEVIAIKENNTPNYSHAEQLHVFISECIAEVDVSLADLDAVAISKGPGSYTGLRIGVSAAKGLCFSLDIPLISVPTLQSMAHQVGLKPNELVIPVLDARRMEVYCCVYDSEYKEVRETRAEIVNEESFAKYVSDNKVYVVGSGAEKCRGVLQHPNFIFDEAIVPSAKDMVSIAFKKYESKRFEDVAYFEPYYLKDFVLQQKKKKN